MDSQQQPNRSDGVPGVEELGELVRVILDPAHPAVSLRPEVLALAELLSRTSGFAADGGADISAGETRGVQGLAISPTMAAMCAQDFARTVVFMRGVHDAIAQARSDKAQQPVHVLYAGCGPLGILCLPLMAILTEREAVFSLLDIHAESVEAVRRTVVALGFESRARAMAQADALGFQPDPACKADVIVLEVMNRCLEKEPQVALTRHLVSGSPEALLVPAEIRIEAALMAAPSATNAPRPAPVGLGTVFELTAEKVGHWAGLAETLPAASVRFPDRFPDGLQPMLRTVIRTHGEHRLADYDSGLTLPRAFPGFAGALAGATVKMSYHCGERPGLVAEPVDAA